jgi:nucleoside-diphosphate-sugar epimerase
MILVTGGTGLVGAHLLLHLAESENTLRAIYRESKAIEKTRALFHQFQKEALFSKIEWVCADVTDIPSLTLAFRNIDYVYHCAGLISYDPKDEKKLRKINIEGTANIVNFCLEYKVKKLCHVSSIAALGDIVPQAFEKTAYQSTITEETEWNPELDHSDYAISKYGAEIEVWRGQQEGLDVVIVNPGVIFGVGFYDQGSGLFFSTIKKGFPFYTQGSTAYVGVRDVVKVMILLMKSTIVGERFILIAENQTYQKVIFTIAEKLEVQKPKFEAKPWLLNVVWRLDWILATFFRTKRKLTKYSANSLITSEMISNQKIKDTLNYNFESLEDVIDEVALNFKENYCT